MFIFERNNYNSRYIKISLEKQNNSIVDNSNNNNIYMTNNNNFLLINDVEVLSHPNLRQNLLNQDYYVIDLLNNLKCFNIRFEYKQTSYLNSIFTKLTDPYITNLFLFDSFYLDNEDSLSFIFKKNIRFQLVTYLIKIAKFR